jgi:glycosyltransferase involved in cell wall biosynthesis
MTSSLAGAGLHVLVYGSLDAGVTDSLRIGSFVQPLSRLGVDVRSWQSFADDLLVAGAPAATIRSRTPGPGGSSTVRARRGRAGTSGQSQDEFLRESGLAALAWADVLVFRRWRSTHFVCTECDLGFEGDIPLDTHIRRTGHRTLVPDTLIRPIVELLSVHPELLGDRGVLYDADDDILDYPDWTGLGAAARRERDLALRILSMADVVTAATPVLADRLRAHARGDLRVVRNAVDPAWYSGRPETGLVGDPRVVYHGVPVRLRDYEVARPAVDELAVAHRGLRRVWIGAAHEPRVVACVDEARPWVDGLAAFGAALVAARPDIGIAPLVDEPFNRAKSELHWLEYSIVGAPVVATAFDGPGPYDVIRDGEDGLLAHSAADWARQLRRLAGSAWLRSEIGAAARRRVLSDYTVETRALEWADTFRWAATHGGFARAHAAAGTRGHAIPTRQAGPARSLASPSPVTTSAAAPRRQG